MPVRTQTWVWSVVGLPAPHLRCVRPREKGSLPSAHHLHIHLPPGRAHGENIHFAPPISSCQRVDLTQQPFRLHADFGPQERLDVEYRLPVMSASWTSETQQHFRLGVAVSYAQSQLGDDLF